MIRIAKVFGILLLLCLYLDVPGQSGSSGILLIYEYRNTGLGTRERVNLYSKGAESLSVFYGKDTLASNSGPKDFSYAGDDSLGRQVYRNLATRELLFRDFFPSRGEFEPCVVNDPLIEMKWSFTGHIRKIGKYTCKSARTDFRGRSYEAWYTEEIPLQQGPWKFVGLPGAIVEIHSTDNIIQFELNEVQTAALPILRKPSAGKTLTMVEFVHSRDESVNEFISALKARLPRGAEVTVNSMGDYNLETDFSDIRK